MNETIECTAKQWGSSLGIIIPNEIVKAQHIKPGEKMQVSMKKMILARDIWNLGPVKENRSTQEIVDELKKGW